MKTFKDDAPLRLSLPWEPPVEFDERSWKHTLGDRVEDAKLSELIGHFNCYDVVAGRIHFYMHPPIRKNALSKSLKTDRRWMAFKQNNPDVELTWAEDLAEINQ